jgi:hypothetical protein
MSRTAQERIVEAVWRDPICKQRLEDRLNRYPHIRQICENTISKPDPSFCCHALKFRMALWQSEYLFTRLESLLVGAWSVPGFEHELSKIQGNLGSYKKIFEFLWPLQVVDFFKRGSASVDFKPNGGPDLVVRPFGHEQRTFFVECYFYNKYWGIEQFITDILHARFPGFELRRRAGLRLEESDARDMIDVLLSPLANDPSAPTPGGVVSAWPSAGEPDWLIARTGTVDENNARLDGRASYLHFFRESVNNKKDSNKLEKHRPNLLAVNALGMDFQLAASSWPDQALPYVELPEPIDGVWWSCCGYDQPLGIQHGRYMLRSLDHPFMLLVPGTN